MDRTVSDEAFALRGSLQHRREVRAARSSARGVKRSPQVKIPGRTREGQRKRCRTRLGNGDGGGSPSTVHGSQDIPRATDEDAHIRALACEKDGSCKQNKKSLTSDLVAAVGSEKNGITEGEGASLAPPDGNRAYRSHLIQALKHVLLSRNDFVALFSSSEVQLGENLLALSPNSLGLLARLLQRKGPWFKSASFGRTYFEHCQDPDAHVEIAVEELISACALQRLCPKSSIDQALCAAESALSAGELLSILRNAKLNNTKTSQKKRDSLIVLHGFAKKQKSLFGAAPPIAKLVVSVLKDCKHDPQRARNHLVAVSDHCTQLVSRVMALYYVTCADSSQPKQSSEEMSIGAGASASATLSNHSSLSGGALGAGCTAGPRPGLLQMFGKIKFHDYRCLVSCPMFETRKHFDLYQVAIVLREISEQRFLLDDVGDRRKRASESASTCRQDESCLSKSNLFDLDPNVPGAGIAHYVGKCSSEAFARLIERFLHQYLQWSQNFSIDVPRFFMPFRADGVLVIAFSLAIESVEKSKDYALASELWRALLHLEAPVSAKHRRRGFWWNRLAIDLKHCGKVEDAIEACVACLLDCSISDQSAHRVEAHKRLARLLARESNARLAAIAVPHAEQVLAATRTDVCESNVPIVQLFGRMRPKQKRNGQTISSGIKKCEYVSGKEQETMRLFCRVEEFVLEHFEENGGWHGHHCEGSIFRSLFALLMWDVIFDNSHDNVFQTPFQGAPLDLWCPGEEFLKARSAKVARVVAQIAASTPPELALLVRRAWAAHCGTCVTGHHWDRFSRTELESIAACLGPSTLVAILQRLASDYAHWGGGGPDLILYRIKTQQGAPACNVEQKAQDKEGEVIDFQQDWVYECKFLEVKSKNDRLSDKQISWIVYLNKCKEGIASVCKVTDQIASNVADRIGSDTPM